MIKIDYMIGAVRLEVEEHEDGGFAITSSLGDETLECASCSPVKYEGELDDRNARARAAFNAGKIHQSALLKAIAIKNRPHLG